MQTVYEWDVETVTTIDTNEHEAEEVLEHRHCQTFSEALRESRMHAPEGCRFDIALVRDGTDGRTWAYPLDDDKGTYMLPKYFANAFEGRSERVPQRYHDEVAKACA